MTDSAPRIIKREDGETIAYHVHSGKSPGVVFLTGLKSDMQGGKALALEAWCKKKGRAFLRFDYYGHGESSGDFENGTLSRWSDDAAFALDELTEGPQVLVGSSMGGWAMLLAALKRPERVAGLVGLAAAPDFTRDLMDRELNDEQRAQMQRDGVVYIPNCYDPDTPYTITQKLIDDGEDNILLDGPIAISCPVRLIHGQQDEDVPWPTSMKLVEQLESTDVELTLVKDGTHRLSEDHHLRRLEVTVAELLAKIS